jgi:Undecaprenyl-phosphate glucose phosphotransferase
MYEFFFRLCCFALPVLAFLIAGNSLRVLDLINPLSHDYLYLCVTLELVWIVCSVHFDVTNLEALFLEANGKRNCIKAIAWTYMSCFSALFFYRGASYSRLLLGTSGIILLAEVFLLRVVARSMVKRAGQLGERLRVIVIGADAFARQTSERLRSNVVTPCDTVAYVRIPGQQVSVEDGIPVFELDQLKSQNVKRFANDLVIAASPEILPILSAVIVQLKGLAIPIRFCLDLGQDVRVRERFFRVGGTHILDVQIAPSETISYVILKRSFDLVFSALVLTLGALPMLLIAIAVRISSPGPVLFSQDRVGINGQVFKMWKFRTMRTSSTSDSDTQWTTAADVRCTTIGMFLRKSSLDELPQFFNVLRGDMSVVGPRPERPYFVDKFIDEIDAYNTRHHLKSGITGWAQVNGLRGDTDIAKRVELDIYYIQNWSLAFDLQIILMTVFSGMFVENAY